MKNRIADPKKSALAMAAVLLSSSAAWAAGPGGPVSDTQSVHGAKAAGMNSASRSVPEFLPLGRSTAGISGDGLRVLLGGLEGGIVSWTADGGFQEVAAPGSFGRPSFFAAAISTEGLTIVATRVGALAEPSAAVRWDLIDDEWAYGVIDSGWAQAFGVNANGMVIVGESNSLGAPVDFPTRWASFGGGQVDYNSGVEIFSTTNADGTVTVGSGNSGAFRWVHDTACSSLCGEPEYLIPTGSFWSNAYAVDASGAVVAGQRYTAANFGETVAFRWTATQGAVDLGLLPGAVSSYASEISGDAQVIGGSSGGRAFLWSESTGILDLTLHLQALGVDMPGWELIGLTGLSADGSAACGNGFLNGERRGWVVSSLPVACRADLDRNNRLTFSDLTMWLQAFVDRQPAGDWNYDGLFGFTDSQAYLAAFNAGCP